MVKNYAASNIDELFRHVSLVHDNREDALIIVNFPVVTGNPLSVSDALTLTSNIYILSAGLNLRHEVIICPNSNDYKITGRVIMPEKIIQLTYSLNEHYALPQVLLTSVEDKIDTNIFRTLTKVLPAYKSSFDVTLKPKIFENRIMSWATFGLNIGELTSNIDKLFFDLESGLETMNKKLSNAKSLLEDIKR